MPKIKTVSGAKKRFKPNAKGTHIRRAKNNHNHILITKNAKRNRRLRTMGSVSDQDMEAVKRMLVL